MPSNWLSVDSNFPSFTGDESPTQQIRALHNYLYCMKEQLQYSLQNLTADNWNGAALQSLTDGAKTELSEQLQLLRNQVSDVRARLETLAGRVVDVSDLVSRVSDAETAIAEQNEKLQALDEAELDSRLSAVETSATDHDLRLDAAEDTIADQGARLGGAETALEDHESRILALENINADVRMSYLENEGLPARVEVLEEIVREDVNENVTLGREGKQLHLVGEIYVNGVLLTPASGEEETVTDETA